MHHTVLRRWRTLLAALACGLLLSCGGGGGSSGAPPAASTALANVCTVPGQKSFMRAYLGENYYWYNEIPAINANLYASPVDYFYDLLVTTPDANGLPKDLFSFVASVADANSFESGVSAGFGVQWEQDALGRTRVAQVVPGSPAATAGMARGGLLVAVVGGNTSSWYPNAFGATRTFDYQNTPVSPTRRIMLVTATLNENPVPQFSVVNSAAGRTVGYVLFNDHSDSAQDQLITAIGSLRNNNVRDLVLDMRYNGGGFLYVAQSLASMVTGPVNDSRVFERLQFNDKRPADSAAFVFRFSGQVEFSQGFAAVGDPLPRLALPRVYVLTSAGTCSASESVVNGLRGVGVQVVLVGGDATCGKPYGFTRQDNCGLALFPIEFEGFNAVNTGGYTAGFAPTCSASDDFDHALGDVNERQLAAALFHADNGFCPPAAVAPSALGTVRRSASGGQAASAPAKPQRPGKLLVGGAR